MLPFDGHLGKEPRDSSTADQSVVLGSPVLGKMGLLLEMPLFPRTFRRNLIIVMGQFSRSQFLLCPGHSLSTYDNCCLC